MERHLFAEAEIRKIVPKTGEVLGGTGVSGLESDGAEKFFCGGSGKVRAIRRSKRAL